MTAPTSAPVTASPRYTGTAIALHWVIAGLIICALVLGWIMTDLAFSPTKLKMYSWHKWIGITVLGLAAVRGIWRLTHQPPAPVPMPVWQTRTAHGIHIALYVLMFLQPINGWLLSNASGYPVVYLGVLPLPNLVAKNRELSETLAAVHGAGATLFVVCFLLHALAAMKHHFIDRDSTLRRMLPFAK